MSAQHTPGPWVIAGTEIHDRATEHDETGARIGNTPNSIAKLYSMPNAGEMAFNAELIAAAPELLNALKELMLECWHDGPDKWEPRRAYCRARVAIAKAEGRM